MEVTSESWPEELTSKTPAVSWLLCSYLVNDHLKLAIDSCLNQTFNDFELVFVANSPMAHKVAEYVREWYGTDPRVRIFTTPIRQLSFSLSLGLHHARAPLIARMDSDDISSPDRLERQVAFMNQHPEVAVLGTFYEVIDNYGLVQKKVTLPVTDRAIRNGLLSGNPICHPTVMLRRQYILDVGGYLGGPYAEDYVLWARLSLNPMIHFANLPQVCLGYRAISVGAARRSRLAYATMASSQFQNFLVGAGLSWIFSAILSVLKLIMRSSPVRDWR